MNKILKRAPVVLGIESSCDETGAAIIKEGTLVSDVVATQLIHEAYGGVVPELAARAHQEKIVKVVELALAKADLSMEEVGAIAVTQGPGLLGALLVGASFANGLALGSNLALFGIHHTKAHLLANFIEEPVPAFPLLGLIVSGGHTQIVLVESPLKMTLLGSTLDDAVGEAFDKIAKMMGMPYPGGVHIDHWAKGGNPARFKFPTTRVRGLDFSFSGIKTAFLYFLKREIAKEPNFVAMNKADLCASVQGVLVEMLMSKLREVVKVTGIKNIALGGGVANNTGLRAKLAVYEKVKNWQVYIPRPTYCTDNAAMIAMAGHFCCINGVAPHEVVVACPRMKFE